MSKPTHNYATLVTPGTKKISVCARRIGSRDRLAVIAVCTHEPDAEKIVDGLNLLQAQIVKLNAPAERALLDVREALRAESLRTTAANSKVRDLENQLRDFKTRESSIARDLANQTVRANRAEEQLAQLKAATKPVDA